MSGKSKWKWYLLTLWITSWSNEPCASKWYAGIMKFGAAGVSDGDVDGLTVSVDIDFDLSFPLTWPVGRTRNVCDPRTWKDQIDVSLKEEKKNNCVFILDLFGIFRINLFNFNITDCQEYYKKQINFHSSICWTAFSFRIFHDTFQFNTIRTFS